MTLFDRPLNIVHAGQHHQREVFAGIVSSMQAALEPLGLLPCTSTEDKLIEGALNVIVGVGEFVCSCFSDKPLRSPYVVCQMEELSRDVGFLDRHPRYSEVLQNAAGLWECSEANIRALKRHGFSHLRYLPFGYHPRIEKLNPRSPKDVDVVFWGSITPRQAHILQRIRSSGLTAKATVAACGEALHHHLERAKVVVIVHDPGVPSFLAQERLAFLLANRCVVIAETHDDNPYEDGVVGCHYDQLVETSVSYAQKGDLERGAIAERGYHAIRRFDMTEILKTALDEILARIADRKPPEEGNGDYYQHARPDVLQLVPLWAGAVLDIGCGAGALGTGLKARQACHVTGLELSPEAAAAAARGLDLVICGDACSTMQGLPDDHFDAVIMADVLEHVADTDRMLQLVRLKMRAGGKLILSIPNIRHWSVLGPLLEGQWEYQDAGILDKTHLRFFTLSSILRRLAVNGFVVEQSLATSFGEGAPRALVETIGAFGLNVADLEADSHRYQYLLVCSKGAG